MQKGSIKSYDKEGGSGMIDRLGDSEVKFFSTNVIGRDRMSLKTGDNVWYEIDNVKNVQIAINIRKA